MMGIQVELFLGTPWLVSTSIFRVSFGQKKAIALLVSRLLTYDLSKRTYQKFTFL
jgi:hypothetical protein